MRVCKSLLSLVSLGLVQGALAEGADALKLKLSGKGWYEFGRVMSSSDTLVTKYNYNDNFIHSPGAQFTILAEIGEHWNGAMGFGGYETQAPQGGVANSVQRKSETGFKVYVTCSRPPSASSPSSIIPTSRTSANT
jgi:hypothetical protein